MVNVPGALPGNLPDGSAEITVWLDAARGGDRQDLDRVLGTL